MISVAILSERLKLMQDEMLNNDFDTAAAVLGVNRSTLPLCVPVEPPAQPMRPREPVVDFTPLSDHEWACIAPHIPVLPVPKPDEDFRTRDFLDSVIWWIAARERGLGWGKLPQRYWPISSREHRQRRWSELGWFRQLADALLSEALLGEKRLRQFERIALDAEARKVRLHAARERLTGTR